MVISLWIMNMDTNENLRTKGCIWCRWKSDVGLTDVGRSLLSSRQSLGKINSGERSSFDAAPLHTIRRRSNLLVGRFRRRRSPASNADIASRSRRVPSARKHQRTSDRFRVERASFGARHVGMPDSATPGYGKHGVGVPATGWTRIWFAACCPEGE